MKRNQKHPKATVFTPTNPDKYIGKNLKNIVSRSSWELKFMQWCDTSPQVLQWASEFVVIPYKSTLDGRLHRYFVDFLVTIAGDDKTPEKRLLIEIKPYYQTIVPIRSKKTGIRGIMAYNRAVRDFVKNQDKWDTATKFAKEHGMIFKVLTEKDITAFNKGS